MTINRIVLAGAAAIVASSWLATAQTAHAAVACRPIRNVAELSAIRANLSGSYCLMNDIDAGSVANFAPIGYAEPGKYFTGKLFGNGRVIRNLRIRSNAVNVGLFGAVDEGALIQDVGLVNADIIGMASGYVGGLVGAVRSSLHPSEIRRVHVSGRVAAPDDGFSSVGSIVGYGSGLTLADSWSSADVSGSTFVGGAIGYAERTTISRVYATGQVACPQDCDAGGLMGVGQVGTTVILSYASGRVAAGDTGRAGGLVGSAIGITIQRSHALGAVTAGSGALPGGLIGLLNYGALAQVYAVGRVTGGSTTELGGLVGAISGTPTVTHAYWDINTSARPASAVGTGLTTVQLRGALPAGFGNAWAITANRSYPFLNEADLGLAAPLATLVKQNRIYAFLPIGQLDRSQYAAAPAHANAASLAAVYTMIARAIGITRGVSALRDARIDTYFWNDATQTASWNGPVTNEATLGPLIAIPAGTPLNSANVLPEMANGRLVVLRGAYGAGATHWMLGTLHTNQPGGIGSVIAHDPWTGAQLMIDPATKTVTWPTNHPLSNFRVNGYQRVTLN